jgi:acyl-CoA reductase-like NAD-dependent aldehyde dehydrogenase
VLRDKEMDDVRFVRFGGQSNESDCYIALLLLMNDIDSLIMKDEIFGPLYT